MSQKTSWEDAEIMADPSGYLDWSQVKRLLQTARHFNQRDYLLLRALLGRRVSEVVRKYGIRPRDISPPNVIHFVNLKAKKLKRYPQVINRDYVEKLTNYISKNKIPDDKPVFPISRQRVFQIIRKYGEMCGIHYVGNTKLHPHHLRHSYAVWYAKNAKNPMDIYKLQKKLMHANVNMTMWYISTFGQEEEDTEGLDSEI